MSMVMKSEPELSEGTSERTLVPLRTQVPSASGLGKTQLVNEDRAVSLQVSCRLPLVAVTITSEPTTKPAMERLGRLTEVTPSKLLEPESEADARTGLAGAGGNILLVAGEVCVTVPESFFAVTTDLT